MRHLWLQRASLFVLSLSPWLPAAGVLAASPASQPVAVVELFTSEGCSSCPPADDLLRRINLRDTTSGQLIIGISEHVTYWNRLGWKDVYSQELFTYRQTAYAQRFALQGPYTSQMVVNGQEEFVGSDSARLLGALHTEATRPRIDAAITSVSATKEGLHAQLRFQGVFSRPLDLFAVLTDDSDQSHVLRGENAGSTLQHVAVARTLEKLGRVSANGQKTADLHVPEDLRASLHGTHHLVIFLQEPGQGAIVGAATLPL